MLSTKDNIRRTLGTLKKGDMIANLIKIDSWKSRSTKLATQPCKASKQGLGRCWLDTGQYNQGLSLTEIIQAAHDCLVYLKDGESGTR
ncbi:hypothetical protein PFICI_11557 [Pestalotiopsis fici W106-1]|uniref:Uncharacterized protein n=1 Tax=Pestalotiopsis fici (strain W106-1 / CGMCC3.15140) TaxID=1229662 RepID=W3WQL2_PESFW|nr:uncharacterized protein PFICI_11557 [Pestalotiopsis fici W106-1]ETS76170.1 hypothetical protein PFICI_11557 [Pestalotiopsis fici W106-1]